MNSMEFNKIAGATIGALLVFLLLGFFSEIIYGTREVAPHITDEEHGPVLAYAVPVEAGEDAAPAEEEQVDLLALFEHPDVAAGERAFRACGACHALEPGVNRVGPTLHDVVGADIAAVEGFAYSDAMAALEGDWTPEFLFDFLGNPRGVVPGTKMSFAGIDDPAGRANVVAYLNQVGDTPVDLTEGIEPVETAAAGDAGAAPEAEAPAPEAEAPATEAEAPAPGPEATAGTEAEAPPVVTPESATETTTSTLAGAEDAGEVTGTTVVDTSDEDVEVESTTPMEVDEVDPVDAAPLAEQPGEPVEPVDGSATQETPAEGQAAVEGAGDAPAAPAEPADEQVAVATPAPEAALAGDAAAGEALFRRCIACHKLDEGRHGIGPSLNGIVGREVAGVEGYDYSEALAAHGGVWSPERLSAFLENPRAAVPGTKMAFAGLKDEQDRIDLITYLQGAAQ